MTTTLALLQRTANNLRTEIEEITAAAKSAEDAQMRRRERVRKLMAELAEHEDAILYIEQRSK